MEGNGEHPLTIFTDDAFRLVPARRRLDGLATVTGRLACLAAISVLLTTGAMVTGGVEVAGRVTSVRTLTTGGPRGSGRRTVMDVQAAPGGVRCTGLPTGQATKEGAEVRLRYVPWWPAQCALAGPFRLSTDLSCLLAIVAGTLQFVALLFLALDGDSRRLPPAEPPYAHRWSDEQLGHEWRLAPLD